MELVLALPDGVTSCSHRLASSPIQEFYGVGPSTSSGAGTSLGPVKGPPGGVPAVETRRLTDFTWIKLDCNGKTSIVPP